MSPKNSFADPHLKVPEEVLHSDQPHVVVKGDAHVLGIPGHVDHLADVQQPRVVQREGQVGLDVPRRGPGRIAGEGSRSGRTSAVVIIRFRREMLL